MIDAALHTEIAAAQQARVPCALATVVSTRGSVPVRPGRRCSSTPMGASRGTVGGGKFESLVMAEAQESHRRTARRA